MLMNDFYTLSHIVQTENKWEGKIMFNAAHAIFKGHFPGQPVVPGVCMMQIVKEVLENAMNKKIRITQAAQVKFLQLITPDSSPVIHIEWKVAEDALLVNAQFKTEKDVFKMTATMNVSEKI